MAVVHPVAPGSYLHIGIVDRTHNKLRLLHILKLLAMALVTALGVQ